MKTYRAIHARNGTMSPIGIGHYYWQWAHLDYSHQIHIGQSKLPHGTIPMSHALNNLNIFFLFH